MQEDKHKCEFTTRDQRKHGHLRAKSYLTTTNSMDTTAQACAGGVMVRLMDAVNIRHMEVGTLNTITGQRVIQNTDVRATHNSIRSDF